MTASDLVEISPLPVGAVVKINGRELVVDRLSIEMRAGDLPRVTVRLVNPIVEMVGCYTAEIEVISPMPRVTELLRHEIPWREGDR